MYFTIKKYAGAFEIVKVIFHQHSPFLPPFFLPSSVAAANAFLVESLKGTFSVCYRIAIIFLCNNFSMSVIYIYWHHVSAIIMFFPLSYELLYAICCSIFIEYSNWETIIMISPTRNS